MLSTESPNFPSSKPWENTHSTPISPSIFAPPPPPPLPLYSSSFQDPSSSINQNNSWFGSNGPSTYSGGFNRFGYPSNYGSSSYNSYTSPYYMNSNPLGGGPPAPGSYITTSLENTARPLFDSLNHVLQALNNIACFVDSTVFAVWTSVTAAGSLVSVIKSIKNVHLRKWLEVINLYLKNIKLALKSSSGRKKIILLISLVASIPVLFKIFQIILKIDDNDQTSIIIRNQNQLTNKDEDIILDSDELSSSKAAFVRAIYAYSPADKNSYLTLNPGDVILISNDDIPKLEDNQANWIIGKVKSGFSGYFPSNYVTVIK